MRLVDWEPYDQYGWDAPGNAPMNNDNTLPAQQIHQAAAPSDSDITTLMVRECLMLSIVSDVIWIDCVEYGIRAGSSCSSSPEQR
jgi:hypothetical protein